MNHDRIASLLLCQLCKKLPDDPVVCNDGFIYDRSELESEIKDDGESPPLEFYPSSQIKRVIELLVDSGSVDNKYLRNRYKGSGGDSERIANKSHAKNTPDEYDKNAVDFFLLVKAEAEEGDVVRMVELGKLYLKGRGTKKDEKEGYRWFDLASERGNELGTTWKADCLVAGLGVQQDREAGRLILVEAANSDDSAPAALRLWYYHSEGLNGFKQDSSKAKKALQKLKEISPMLSDDDIQQKKKELVEFIQSWFIESPPTERENDKKMRPSMEEPSTMNADPEVLVAKMEHEPVTKPTKGNPRTREDKINAKKPQFLHNNTEMRASTALIDASGIPQQKTNDEASAGKEDDVKVVKDEPTKQCSLCGHSKAKNAFSISQWQMRSRCGTCKYCCKEDPTPNQSNGDVTSLQHNEKNTLVPSERKQSVSSKNNASVFDASNSNQASVPDDIDAESSTAEDVEKEEGGKNPLAMSSETVENKEAPSKAAEEEPKQIPVARVSSSNGPSYPNPAPHENAPHVKPCSACGQSKPQADFTASQWKKKVGTGKCFTCVSKCVQWQTGSVATFLQKKACGECKVSKQHAQFSPNQWRKAEGTGRCRECVKKGLSRNI